MFHRLREPFGKAGLIVAMVALVAAVGGSAIAANTASDSGKRNAKAKKKKQKGVTVSQVRKIAKQEARKFANSNPGPAGPQGPAGANGNDGQNGSNGDQGTQGKNGSAGDDGTSATVASFAGSKGTCTEGQGGLEVKSASPAAFVCNGTEGAPWSAGGVLPEGETLTGGFSISSETGTGVLASYATSSISFNIPLAQPIEEGNAFFIQLAESVPTECEDETHPGAASAENPEAKPGNLCVFAGYEQNVEAGESLAFNLGFSVENAASVSGASLFMVPEAAEAISFGSWAVTAPVPGP